MDKLILTRTYEKAQTIGKLNGTNINLCTIELKWNNNTPRDSCIPEGKYKVTPRTSPKHGKHFLINNVPNRDLCLFHSANYARELLGCIAPGLAHVDIDGDGNLDVTSSKIAMETLLYRYPNGFELIIESKKNKTKR